MSSRILSRRDSAAGGREIEPMVWRGVDPLQKAAPDLAGLTTAPLGSELQQTEALTTHIAELAETLEHRVREAHQSGFEEGEAAGRMQAAAGVNPVLERLGKTIENLSELRHRLRREAESDVLHLSIAIARRILNRAVAIDPEAMRGIIQVALERLRSQQICRLRVHPEHLSFLKTCVDTSGSPVEVTADAGLERGGAVFETARGNLDASLESQLREIEQGLADRLKGKA